MTAPRFTYAIEAGQDGSRRSVRVLLTVTNETPLKGPHHAHLLLRMAFAPFTGQGTIYHEHLNHKFSYLWHLNDDGTVLTLMDNTSPERWAGVDIYAERMKALAAHLTLVAEKWHPFLLLVHEALAETLVGITTALERHQYVDEKEFLNVQSGMHELENRMDTISRDVLSLEERKLDREPMPPAPDPDERDSVEDIV